MSSDNEQYIQENVNFQRILSEWSEAVSDFYMNYSKLISCLKNGNQIVNNREIQIGQCPVSLLTRLVDQMHLELEKLNREMNKEISSDRIHGCKVLSAHTTVINELNQQAESSLILALLSAS